MVGLRSLINRNVKIFYRTKGNLIFAMLSVFILVALHFVVFRNMYSENWYEVFSQIPNFNIEIKDANWIVDSLMFAAIIPIGSITISLVSLGVMIADKENN
ncbi:MAG: hypothetical protein ACRCZK_03320, partial [Oscillospiraceae bacterium]